MHVCVCVACVRDSCGGVKLPSQFPLLSLLASVRSVVSFALISLATLVCEKNEHYKKKQGVNTPRWGVGIG